MSKKLKKCPFCGNEKGVEFVSSKELCKSSDRKGWYVICNYNKDGCGATGGCGNDGKKEARKIWNQRT